MPIAKPNRTDRKMDDGDLGHVTTSGLRGREGGSPRGSQGGFTTEEGRDVGRQPP